MTMSDPIADMLTRIRNANTQKHDTVNVPSSKMKLAIAQILLYEGYIKKQIEQVQRSASLENRMIPQDLEYEAVSGISNEARQKLSTIRPGSIGQASRISGVSPADISLLTIFIEQLRRRTNDEA